MPYDEAHSGPQGEPQPQQLHLGRLSTALELLCALAEENFLGGVAGAGAAWGGPELAQSRLEDVMWLVEEAAATSGRAGEGTGGPAAELVLATLAAWLRAGVTLSELYSHNKALWGFLVRSLSLPQPVPARRAAEVLSELVLAQELLEGRDEAVGALLRAIPVRCRAAGGQREGLL